MFMILPSLLSLLLPLEPADHLILAVDRVGQHLFIGNDLICKLAKLTRPVFL